MSLRRELSAGPNRRRARYRQCAESLLARLVSACILIRFLLDYQRVIDIARHGAARFWPTAWTAGTTKDQAGTGRCSELLGMIRVLLAAPQAYVIGPWQPGSHFLVRRSSA
jgi:hypothetical protein